MGTPLQIAAARRCEREFREGRAEAGLDPAPDDAVKATRLGFASRLVGRRVGSFTELSDAECRLLIRRARELSPATEPA